MKLSTHALLAIAASTGTLALTVSSSVQNACAQLQSTYPEELLMPNSSDYESERINFWDKRSNMEPACIFLPTTVDAVADAVTIFHKEKAQFAIRGGGHMNVSLPPCSK
jgi:FAD/FMN-containing dehydrogenase